MEHPTWQETHRPSQEPARGRSSARQQPDSQATASNTRSRTPPPSTSASSTVPADTTKKVVQYHELTLQQRADQVAHTPVRFDLMDETTDFDTDRDYLTERIEYRTHIALTPRGRANLAFILDDCSRTLNWDPLQVKYMDYFYDKYGYMAPRLAEIITTTAPLYLWLQRWDRDWTTSLHNVYILTRYDGTHIRRLLEFVRLALKQKMTIHDQIIPNLREAAFHPSQRDDLASYTSVHRYHDGLETEEQYLGKPEHKFFQSLLTHSYNTAHGQSEDSEWIILRLAANTFNTAYDLEARITAGETCHNELQDAKRRLLALDVADAPSMVNTPTRD